MLREMFKKMNLKVPALVPLPWHPGQPCAWQAMADLFLSYGDSDSELHNLSTQLARFPLSSHYHTNPMLQIPQSLCGVPQAKPCLAAIFLS